MGDGNSRRLAANEVDRLESQIDLYS